MKDDSTTTLTSSLAHTIRQDIIRGVYEPKARLRIKELCEVYGSSTIPTREALSRLASTGFVIAEDQRGFRVPDISKEELNDITQARIHIECEALRLSIHYANLEWEEQLLMAHHRLQRLPIIEKDKMTAEWEKAHEAFHAALINGCQSRWLINLSGILRDQTARYRHISIKSTVKGNPEQMSRNVIDEHERLLNASLAGDAQLACQLLTSHYQKTSELVLWHYDAFQKTKS